ncbi:GPP34 family phosphoprotein [Streptomyces sp. ODS28]|uniref:GOLPH3/VPS74 family protein n=1 Tax=Streptomyces sp. ODS28 TaxID=3136688 RepID=UPI0031EB4210
MRVTTLDQQLVLLTLDSRGAFRDRYKTEFAAAGGVLLELALHARIDVPDGTVTAVDATPTGQPPLDAALERIAASEHPYPTRRWVRELRRSAFENAVDALTTAGLLRTEPHRTLGLLLTPRHPRTGEAAERAERTLRKRLSDLVTCADEPADARTACLAVLADAARLHRWAFPQTDARTVGERARELAAAGLIAPAVRGAVEVVQREAAAAVTAGAAGATAY